MRRLISVLICLSMMGSGLVWGQDLKKIEVLYDDMEFEEARKAVNTLLKRDDLQPEQVVGAMRIKGLSLSADGMSEESIEVFNRLLAIQPDFKLSADISPKLAAPFYQALAMAQSFGPIAVEHKSPAKVAKLDGLELLVDLRDPHGMIAGLRLVYRVGTSAWIKTASVTVAGPGPAKLKLPGSLGKDLLSYYFEAISPSGSVLHRSPGPDAPLAIKPGGAGIALADADGKTEGGGAVDFGGSGDGLRDDGDQDKGALWYETWWFWTAVGVVVVGAGVGVGVGLGTSGGDPTGPQDYAINIR